MKNSALAILFVTLFLDLLGFGMIIPLIPVYITHYGGAAWIGGFLLASFSTMQFLFAPIWGRLSDRYGRRPLILMSLLGSGLSYFMFGAAPNLAVLFAARVLCGILTAASIPTSQAYIADVTPPDKRAGGMAMLGAAFGLGFAIGPWVGGFLSLHPHWGISPLAMPAYFAGALAVLNFLVALFFLPESLKDRSPNESSEPVNPLKIFSNAFQYLKHPVIGAPLLVFAVATFAFTAVETSFSWLMIMRFKTVMTQMAYDKAGALIWNSLPEAARTLRVETMSTQVTSQIFGIVGLTILITQGAVMGGLAKRVGERRLVQIGALILTLTLVGIAVTHDLLWMKVLSGTLALGNGIMSPSLSALITKYAGRHEMGAVSGAQHGLSSLSRIIAPPINNSLLMANTAIPFFASAVLMSGAFFLSLRLKTVGEETEEVKGREGQWEKKP